MLDSGTAGVGRTGSTIGTRMIRYLLLWLPLAVIGVANGVLREYTYGSLLPELAAHQLSTFSGMLFTGLFVWGMHRRWPIASYRQAWTIGLCWLAFTIAFEFGFGRFVIGHTWARLLADYDVSAGRVWGLFLFWIVILPVLAYRFHRR